MLLPPVSHIAPHVAAVTGDADIIRPSPAAAAAETTTIFVPHGLSLPWLLVRQLGQDDRATLAQHLLDLPPADRSTRFGGPTTDAAIRRHCDALDLEDTICIAALAGDVVVGAALGFACGAGGGCRGRLIEVAVSVAQEHRRCGLGVDLVARVCAAAATRGAAGAAFEFHPRNTAIRGVIRRLGGQIAPLAEVCVVPLPTLSDGNPGLASWCDTAPSRPGAVAATPFQGGSPWL